MIAATSDFKAAAAGDFRDPRARVKVTWVDPSIDPTISVSANDTNRAALLPQAADGRAYTTRRWAHLNGSIIADGSYYAMPINANGDQSGWYGITPSDSAGNFAVSPELTVAFSARPVTEIQLAADNIYGEYPVNFTISVYEGAVLVFQQLYTGNTLVSRTIPITGVVVNNATRTVLAVHKWSAPNAVVKIVEFYSSVTELFGDNDIVSMDILEEINAQSGTLPIGNVSANELTLELLNTNSRFRQGNTNSFYNSLLKVNRRVAIHIGFVLPSGSTDSTDDVEGYIVETEGGRKIGYMPYGTYWTKDWLSEHSSMSTTVVCYDMMERLRNTLFTRSLVYRDVSLYDLATIVLSEASTDIIDLTWRIDEELKKFIIPFAWFDVMSYFDVIRKIVEASTTIAYMDRYNVLIIGRPLAGSIIHANPQILDNIGSTNQIIDTIGGPVEIGDITT